MKIWQVHAMTLLLSVAATAEENPCTKADADRIARKNAAARAQYLDVIKSATSLKNPTLAMCAEEGLLRLVAKDGDIAEQLMRADIGKSEGRQGRGAPGISRGDHARSEREEGARGAS